MIDQWNHDLCTAAAIAAAAAHHALGSLPSLAHLGWTHCSIHQALLLGNPAYHTERRPQHSQKDSRVSPHVSSQRCGNVLALPASHHSYQPPSNASERARQQPGHSCSSAADEPRRMTAQPHSTTTAQTAFPKSCTLELADAFCSCCSAHTWTTSVTKGPTLPELVPAWGQLQGDAQRQPVKGMRLPATTACVSHFGALHVNA